MNNLLIQDHHLMKKHKLNNATLFEILNDANILKLTSQIYFGNLFSNFKPDWKSIYYIDV